MMLSLALPAAPARADARLDRDLALLFEPKMLPGGKLTTPPREPAANGCPAKIKSFGQGRYLAYGLFTDFTLPARKELMRELKALARGRKKLAPIAGQVLDGMRKDIIDSGYYVFYTTVDPDGSVRVDLISKLYFLPQAAPQSSSGVLSAEERAKIDTSEEEKILSEPVKPVIARADKPAAGHDASELGRAPSRVGYAPEGVGPAFAPLPAAAPDFHAMSEPIAIGRDAVATPNLTSEQRIAARDFGDGPLATFARALAGSGDLQSATEKVVSSAQATSLFINPGALTKSLLDLSSAVKFDGRPGKEETASSERNERVATALTAANRQLSTAGLYLAVAVSPTGTTRAEAYFLRGKRSVQVLGDKEYYDLRQISGPLGWYGFYVTKLDVQSDIRDAARAFGDQLSAFLATDAKAGELVTRPHGLANAVQASWGIETLIRRLYGRSVPSGEEFGQMWADGLLLHQGFSSFFRKNGGAEKANRMTNEKTARGVAEQAAFLYQLAQMDPRIVHVTLCVIADRCYRLDSGHPMSLGGRRMFDNFQTESGIQMIDGSGKLRIEGLRDLIALDADRIQQMAAASLVREIIRIYLPGTY